MNRKKTEITTSCEGKQPLASEIIAEQKKEIEKLKKTLEETEEDWELLADQRRIFMYQIDIINTALQIYDYDSLKMALSFVKAAYRQQLPEKEDKE